MKLIRYFSIFELLLWSFSVICIVISFLLFDRVNWVNIISPVIGVTSILLNAKGNPLGQLLMLVFSVFYGVISFHFAYYGEMITYLGMTAPMAVLALISWLRNPFRGKKSEVAVNHISKKEGVFAFLLSGVVTVVFYFILRQLGTAHLLPSTLSVFTSFLAVYLVFRRSEWFSLAYAANDAVLIVLWILASFESMSYISVVICFVMFLFNDVYAFLSWRKMKRRQQLFKD